MTSERYRKMNEWLVGEGNSVDVERRSFEVVRVGEESREERSGDGRRKRGRRPRRRGGTR